MAFRGEGKNTPRDLQGALSRLNQESKDTGTGTERRNRSGQGGKVAGIGKGCEEKCWLGAGRMQWRLAEELWH